MNIKNYTSSVPTERTIGRIELALSKAGASSIVKDYEEGVLKAICFKVKLPNGRPVSIRLPAKPEAVYDAMKSSIRRPRAGTLETLRAQSERTAWKLMQEWVEIQLSLIQMQQADFMQVFLPYAWDGHQTLYDKMLSNGFLALKGGTD